MEGFVEEKGNGKETRVKFAKGNSLHFLFPKKKPKTELIKHDQQ